METVGSAARAWEGHVGSDARCSNGAAALTMAGFSSSAARSRLSDPVTGTGKDCQPRALTHLYVSNMSSAGRIASLRNFE